MEGPLEMHEEDDEEEDKHVCVCVHCRGIVSCLVAGEELEPVTS